MHHDRIFCYAKHILKTSVTTFSVSQVSHCISITTSLNRLGILVRDFAVYNPNLTPLRAVLLFCSQGFSFVAVSSLRRNATTRLGLSVSALS